MKKWISIILVGIFLPSLVIFVSADEEPASSAVQQLLERRQWSEAVAALRDFVQKSGKSVETVMGLATALMHTGAREEALANLVEGTQRFKGADRTYFIQKVRLYSRLFLTNKTFQVYQDGLNLVASKKYRPARERFEKALVEEPDNVEILIRLGQVSILDADPERAVHWMRSAYKLNPFQPEIQLWLGRALVQIGKTKEGLAELTVAYRSLKSSEISSLWLSEALVQTGQSGAAIRLLESDVAQWPLHILGLISLAKLRLQGPHSDATLLWAARKDLQLAFSRLEEYSARDAGVDSSGNLVDLGVDLSRPTPEIKGEIQRLLQQVENRLSQASDQRRSSGATLQSVGPT